MAGETTPWTPEHFIGGHPALDLANAVFDRRVPAQDNELLKTPQDLASWLTASGLLIENQTRCITHAANQELLKSVRAIREATFEIFNDIAGGRDPANAPLGMMMSIAATGLQSGGIEMRSARPLAHAEQLDPSTVPNYLALLTVTAYFTLPTRRIRSCPRCGWVFVDSSRGGQRRWCSMKTCGNRDKVSRHRNRPAT